MERDELTIQRGWRGAHAHRRLLLAAVGAAVVSIVGAFVSVTAALLLVALLLFGFAFTWRAGYTSSALTAWSRSRFESESEQSPVNWMNKLGKTGNGKARKRSR